MSLLQSKVDDLENRNRSCNVVIRGVPEVKGEDLSDILDKICTFLNVIIDKCDIYSAFRSGRQNGERPRSIIVIFKNFFARNDLIKACKEHHKGCNEPSKRLLTSSIGIEGPPQQIYVSEHLTPKMKNLFSKSIQKKRAQVEKYS